MPSKKPPEERARREPNPYIRIQGRIPMQHPARHETMYGTDRPRSASPQHIRNGDHRIGAPRAQLRRERDYENMYREYASGEGELSRSAQRGRGLQRGLRVQGGSPHPPPPQWMQSDKENEYRGRQGDRGGFVLGLSGRGGYVRGGQQATTEGLERDAEASAINEDEDAQRNMDTVGRNINSQDQQDFGTEVNNEAQSQKKLLLAKYEEFLNYACGRFGTGDHTELLIGHAGKPLESHEKFGEFLLNFALEKFGPRNKEGDPKQLMIIEKSELVLIKKDLASKEERIAGLEAQVLDLEDEIQGFAGDGYL